MKILIIGGGGREHALAWKIAQSSLVTKIYCAPGNAGIARHAECVNIPVENLMALLNFALAEKIDLTVVGPEVPLVNGIVDLFIANRLKIFGPTKDAAEMEGSKVYCKDMLRKYGIPTAGYRTFANAKAALAFLNTSPYPVVVKADGLAAGKGAIICQTPSEAIVAIEGIMEKKIFGDAGNEIVVEEFLEGYEASVISVTDGKSIVVLETTQDHKRALDGNKGPNTGGMGAYSPVAAVSESDITRVIKDILVPTVHMMNREKRPFQGVLYAGIMFTRSGPKLLEYNVRFGDPETQPLMVRLKSDIVPLLLAACEGRLDNIAVEWKPDAAVCVVIASGGYPNKYKTGIEIAGIEEAERPGNIVVFHAGTAIRDGRVLSSGGRVLGVTATGPSIDAARARAYEAVAKIDFADAHYRADIAATTSTVAPDPVAI